MRSHRRRSEETHTQKKTCFKVPKLVSTNRNKYVSKWWWFDCNEERNTFCVIRHFFLSLCRAFSAIVVNRQFNLGECVRIGSVFFTAFLKRRPQTGSNAKNEYEKKKYMRKRMFNANPNKLWITRYVQRDQVLMRPDLCNKLKRIFSFHLCLWVQNRKIFWL